MANGDQLDDLRFPDGRDLTFAEIDQLTDDFVLQFGQSCKYIVYIYYIHKAVVSMVHFQGTFLLVEI